MNKKTFTLAVIFLVVTLVWFGINIYWALTRQNNVFDMVDNEFNKKKCKHLDEVNKHKIP